MNVLKDKVSLQLFKSLCYKLNNFSSYFVLPFVSISHFWGSVIKLWYW